MNNRYTGAKGLLLCFLMINLIILPLNKAAFAQSALRERVNEGMQALERKDFDSAREIFSESLVTVRESTNVEWEVTILFYLALTSQQQSKTTKNDEERTELLIQAKGYYEECLSLRPDWGPVLNNQAELYSELGDKEAARDMYQRAVETADSDQTLYRLNLGKILADTGQWQEAVKHLDQVINEQPGNDQAHESLLGLYLEHDHLQTLGYLWQLIELRQLLRAQGYVLRLLPEDFWEDEQRYELLTIFVVCLSEQYYEPASFPETKMAKGLKQFVEHPSIGHGIEQVLLLHESQVTEPEVYSWWSNRFSQYDDPTRGVWPLEGFRKLIRSLGNWFHENKAIDLAEAYYLLAASLNPDDSDPEAYLQLADLYGETDRLDELEDLIREREPALFHGKAQAYRTSQSEKIYQFHRALGVIYSYLEQWGDSGTPNSAIFQLEHAKDVVWRHNDRAEAEGSPDRLIMEPRLLNLLGGVYLKTDDRDGALDSYQAAVRVSKEVDDRGGKVQALEGIGEAYSSKGDHAKALEYYQQSLGVLEEIGNRAGQRGVLLDIGKSCSKMGQYDQALFFFNDSLPIYREFGDQSGEAEVLDRIGRTYELKQQNTKAIQVYEEELKVIRGMIEDGTVEWDTLIKIEQLEQRRDRLIEIERLEQHQDNLKQIERWQIQNRF